MPTYAYVARDSESGKSVQGQIDATSQSEALTELRNRGLIPTQLSEATGLMPSQTAGENRAQVSRNSSAAQKRRKRLKSGRVKTEDLVIVFRQLATMIRAGLPLVEALNTLTEQADKRRLCHALGQIERDVQAGSTFHDAMARHGTIFNPFILSMIKAGEASGQLDIILDQLAIYLEKSAKIVREIKSASMYPAGVLIFCTLIMFVIMTTLVPVFQDVFDGMGEELPLLTKIVIAVSLACRKYWYIIIFSPFVLIFLFKRWKKTKSGRWIHDYYLLRIPVFGPLFQKVAIARFSRALGTLMRSGVNILSALEITAQSAGNVTIESAIMKTRIAIQGGDTITRPLVESGLFPPMVTRMIEVGERTGALEDMLQKVAEYYEDQVDATVAGLTKLIEPMLIVFLGVTIGSVVISMFLPMFKMLESLGGANK